MSTQRTQGHEAAPPLENDFRSLIRGACDGSEDAAWEIIDKYGDAIFRAVRRSLNARLRQRFDSGDFVQLVWQSFFRERSGLERFSAPEEMAAYLVGMARNKVAMEVRRSLVRPTSNMNRERYLDDSAEDVEASLKSREPEPVDTAIARERYHLFLRDTPTHYREIVNLRLMGYKHREIALKVGVDERTVRRVLSRLCEKIGGKK